MQSTGDVGLQQNDLMLLNSITVHECSHLMVGTLPNLASAVRCQIEFVEGWMIVLDAKEEDEMFSQSYCLFCLPICCTTPRTNYQDLYSSLTFLTYNRKISQCRRGTRFTSCKATVNKELEHEEETKIG